MSRGIQGRRDGQQDVQCAQAGKRGFSIRRALPAARRSCHPPCLIGLPVPVTVPNIKDIRWRYCARWDEKPAASLGVSLLRLGICRTRDWTGSAVDFVERGFKRFCKENGSEDARNIWEGDLRIMDHMVELTEQERSQARAEMDGPAQRLRSEEHSLNSSHSSIS